jgi:hypothetical protein
VFYRGEYPRKVARSANRRNFLFGKIFGETSKLRQIEAHLRSSLLIRLSLQARWRACSHHRSA